MNCIKCGKEIVERKSNNAWPLKDKCCDECNFKIVVPLRYALLTHAAIQITEKGKVNIIPNADKLSLESLQELVGGYIEPIFLGNYVVLVDEEGRLKNKHINTTWQLFALSEQCVPLLGNVLLMYKEDLQ